MPKCLFVDNGIVHVATGGQVATCRWESRGGQVFFTGVPVELVEGLRAAYWAWRGKVRAAVFKAATRCWDWA